MNVEIAGKILLALFSVFFLVQLIYYLFIFSKLAFFKKQPAVSKNDPVSVIICARNELKNLRNNLPLILDQDYPDYQVIVVNDCSWDDSGKALEEYEDAYPHLKVVTIQEQERYKHGKKFALSLGIKAAVNEILLFTDADCRPAGKNWLREMTKNTSEIKDIVIGYGAYEKTSGLLNKWIRFDTVFNAIQYLSSAISGNAYMGVGRNLCYKRSLFFKNKGFANHYHILSGDDDLFVNETATSKNVSVEITPESFTLSKPKESFIAWLNQKKRHISTGNFYKPKHKFMLGVFYFSHIFFYLTLIALIILKVKPEIVISVFILRLLIQLFIFGKSMQRLKELDILWLAPIFDFCIILIYPILAISNLFIKNKKWK
ncbi:MAG TPA: glycosyltransferase [Bacteroidia bacterium]|nr:glycosyltransferase [Bacteroidia bacterium]